MKNYQELISKIQDFPTLPTIYSSLLETISNPLSTVQDVANIISKDQASTVKLIKVVNSPLYGIATKVDTVSQAIFYLGFNEVKNIILALSILKLFNDTKSFTYFNIIDLWKHSIAVGIITRILGQKISIVNLENYFVAGLLHDIGKLIFYRIIGDDYAKLLSYNYNNNLVLEETERKELGITHEIAGELIANQWKLPHSITQAIKSHSTFRTDGTSDSILACVHLANIIANLLMLGNSGSNLVAQPNYYVWNYINLPSGSFKEMFQEIIDSYNKSIEILTVSK